MTQQRYYGQAVGLGDPSDSPVPVVPSDTTDLPAGQPRFLHLAVAGDLSAVFRAGEAAVTVKGLAAGYHPLRPLRIRATDTTAADITACY